MGCGLDRAPFFLQGDDILAQLWALGIQVRRRYRGVRINTPGLLMRFRRDKSSRRSLGAWEGVDDGLKMRGIERERGRPKLGSGLEDARMLIWERVRVPIFTPEL